MDEAVEMKKRMVLALLGGNGVPLGDDGPVLRAGVNLEELQMPVRPVIPEMAPEDPASFLGEIQVGVPVRRRVGLR